MAKKIANLSVPVLSDFKRWLTNQQHLKSVTADNYCTWLKQNLISDIETLVPSVALTLSEKNFLNVVPALIQAGVSYKALIVCDLLAEHVEQAIAASVDVQLKNDRSALRKYITFIKQVIKQGGFMGGNVPMPDYDGLMPYRKELRYCVAPVKKGEFDKIDGIDSLVELFGNDHEAFISKVLSESFFFDRNLEITRFDELCRELNDGKAVARYTDDYKTLFPGKSKSEIIKASKAKPVLFAPNDSNGATYCVTLDDDGNRTLRTLINNKTNYWVSNGKANSQFINFKISHLWQRASDPRYFTSLWNVVIVPAWANDLLDKDSNASSLISKMIGTFKAVCIEWYGMKNRNWSSLGLNAMPSIAPGEIVLSGKYTINVIKEKAGNNTFGQISRHLVTVLCNSQSLQA